MHYYYYGVIISIYSIMWQRQIAESKHLNTVETDVLEELNNEAYLAIISPEGVVVCYCIG